MGKLVVYGIEESPPVRATLLTLSALGLPYEFRVVNLMKGEQLTEEYKKKNPQHTVPILEDDGKIIVDSHAICAYLVSKYAKTDSLYPKDHYKRAVVDHRLHYDTGVLFRNLRNILFNLLFFNEVTVTKEKSDAVYEGYDVLEAFLKHDYIAGDSLTIADFCIVATVTSLECLTPVDNARTPKLAGWIKRIASLPYYESANQKGLDILTSMIKIKIAENQ